MGSSNSGTPVADTTSPERRILMLTPAYPPDTGGIERTAGALSSGLADDFHVTVVTSRPTVSAGISRPPAVSVRETRNIPPYGRRATAHLLAEAARTGARRRPDLVLALHIRMMPAARLLARLGGSRSLLIVHAKELGDQPALASAALQWADAVVAVSAFSRRLALEAGADDPRLTVISPGVSPPVRPGRLRDRTGPPTIVTVARLDDQHKGHGVALEAMCLLRRRVPDARWLMIGDGVLRAELERSTERHGLGGSVVWAGSVGEDRLVEALAGARVFTLLSQRPDRGAGEGFGIAFLEANAYGLPVVGGDVPGVDEAVADGVTGLLVNPRDPAAVASALERLIVDTDFAQQLADAGSERAGDLAWPRVVDRYRAVIERVLAEPARAGSTHGVAWVRDLLVGPPHLRSDG